MHQENAALSARLRQVQSTLDQIANVARLINGGGSATPGMFGVTGGRESISPTAPAQRVHVVQEGDSLTRISLRYYNTPARWQEIYAANRDILAGKSALTPGQRLKIPQ